MTTEPSPTRKNSLANQISALGNRLTRAISKGSSEADDDRRAASTDDVKRVVVDSASEKYAPSDGE